MAITQAIANSFKKQLLEGDHNFKQSGGDVFKLALYTAGATLTSATTVYTHFWRSSCFWSIHSRWRCISECRDIYYCWCS
jgi:hypothetical protein